MMEEIRVITCPHCGEDQDKNFYEMVAEGASKGSFYHCCEHVDCKKNFIVDYKFIPAVTTRMHATWW